MPLPADYRSRTAARRLSLARTVFLVALVAMVLHEVLVALTGGPR